MDIIFEYEHFPATYVHVSVAACMLCGLCYWLIIYLVALVALGAQSALAYGIIKAWDSHKMLSDTFSLEGNEMTCLHPIDQQWN